MEIAYCPERFNPGDPAHGVRQVARVIGCSNPDVGEALVALYSQLTTEDVRYVGKLEVAEAAKVIENVQRDINIALVNELARIFPALDVDVEDVLSAAATKWNFHRYTPGVGVGGHCIPVDPYYMIQRAADVGVPAGLITAARAVNRSMPKPRGWRSSRNSCGIPKVPLRCTGFSCLAGRTRQRLVTHRETPAEPLAETLMAKDHCWCLGSLILTTTVSLEGVQWFSTLKKHKTIDMVVWLPHTKPALNSIGKPSSDKCETLSLSTDVEFSI